MHLKGLNNNFTSKTFYHKKKAKSYILLDFMHTATLQV